MKPSYFRRLTPKEVALICGACMLFGCPTNRLLADQVLMQNGDRYGGQVVSLNSDTLLLESDVLGTVRLPRAKIAGVTFGTAAPTYTPHSPTGLAQPALNTQRASTNAPIPATGAWRQLALSSNVVHQIQKRYLSDAGPEANDKFNELVGGLLSGKLDVQDIRAQAQATASQVRALRKEMGDEAGFMLDTYLAILDRFVKETAPAADSTATNHVLAPLPAKSEARDD